MTKKFFVYGTLKVGGHFARRFDDTRKSSLTATLNGFDLYDLGAFPGIVPGDGKVIGELHEYKKLDDALSDMDHIEGYHGDPKHDLYKRIEAEVETENGKEPAFVYVFNRKLPLPGAEKIDSGIWKIKNNIRRKK